MSYSVRWRKAISVSVITHIFLLIGSGFLADKLFSLPPVKEQYLELELVDTPLVNSPIPASAEPRVNIPQPQVQPQPQPQVQPQPQPVTVAQIKRRETLTPQPPAPRQVTETPAVISEEVAAPKAQPAGESSPSTAPPQPSAPASPSGQSGQSGGDSGGGISQPSILKKIEPPYPYAAQQRGIRGTVMIKVIVLPNGLPGNISVSKSSGYGILDNAAVAAVKKWRFIPAKDLRSGKNIECVTIVPVTFRLI